MLYSILKLHISAYLRAGKNAAIRLQLQKLNTRMPKKIVFALSFLMIVMPLSAQDHKNRWVDSVFRSLTVPQKIGQLFMIPVILNSA